MRKILSFFILTLTLLVWNVGAVRAQSCDEYKCNENEENYKECVEKEKNCLQAQVVKLQSEANTLQSAINIINGQIRIQGLRIQQTVAEIGQLEKEITNLSERIEGLGISLDRLSGTLIKRIRESYKQSRLPYKNNLFAADSFNNFLSQYRYINLAQEQTLELMKRTELQRLTYNQQKELKETKQLEVEKLRQELQSQKNILDSQKASKDELLSQTKNNEAIYQQKLKEANEQLASFSRFASTLGVSLLSGQTKCNDWGCYYSQRDSQWGNMLLGSSSWTMAEAGCLVTSVAMVASHYDKSLTPGQIASSNSPFNGADLKFSWSINGVTIERSPSCYSSSCLDNVLESGEPAIVRLKAANFAGTHFIVITSKKDGKYIMHDPAMNNGNDKVFTDSYALNLITRVDRVSVR